MRYSNSGIHGTLLSFACHSSRQCVVSSSAAIHTYIYPEITVCTMYAHHVPETTTRHAHRCECVCVFRCRSRVIRPGRSMMKRSMRIGLQQSHQLQFLTHHDPWHSHESSTASVRGQIQLFTLWTGATTTAGRDPRLLLHLVAPCCEQSDGSGDPQEAKKKV